MLLNRYAARLKYQNTDEKHILGYMWCWGQSENFENNLMLYTLGYVRLATAAEVARIRLVTNESLPDNAVIYFPTDKILDLGDKVKYTNR